MSNSTTSVRTQTVQIEEQEVRISENAIVDAENSKPTILYYIGLVSFILLMLQKELAWNYPEVLFKYISLLTLSFYMLVSFREIDHRHIPLIALAFIVVLLVGFNSEQISLMLLSFALVVGANGLDFRKILKIHFITNLTIFLISFIGSELGMIENRVFHLGMDNMDMIGASTSERYCLGYGWPTGCAIHLSFVCISFWMLKKGKLNWIGILLFLFAVWIIFDMTKTRQASLIVLFVIFASFYVSYFKKHNKTVNKYFGCFSILSIPIFCFLSMYATLAYDENDIAWIATDVIVSGRLSLGQDAIAEYGIPWFGQFVKMMGGDANTDDYNYVDSSFVQSFLLWGIVISVLLVYFFVIITKRAYKRNDIVMLFAIIFAGLSSITSQYLYQISFCPLLLSLFANDSDSVMRQIPSDEDDAEEILSPQLQEINC